MLADDPGLTSRACQVSNREAMVILPSAPRAKRGPPLTLLPTDRWHRLSSAAQLSACTPGSVTNKDSSLMNRSTRRVFVIQRPIFAEASHSQVSVSA